MREDYGLLVAPDIKIQRNYFKEMVKLLGVNVQYQFPLNNKSYTLQGELKTNYSDKIKVGCIFEEYMKQDTAKRLGWDAELQSNVSVIHVPYDLENLQIGCLFTVPSAIDDAPGRVFRVIKLSTTMIYPASISCELALEYETNVAQADTEMFVNTNFNVLNEGD